MPVSAHFSSHAMSTRRCCGFLTPLLVGILFTACASSQPAWHWANALHPGRDAELDLLRCHQVAQLAGEGGTPVQRFILRQAALERCMYELGWQQVDGLGPAPAVASSAAVATGKVMLFGGPERQTYLGCISCHATSPESVFNPVGTFGSVVSPTSIFNRVGQYGSPVSRYSVCNPVAMEPPILVDDYGNARGLLTLNSALPGAVSDDRVVGWLVDLCNR